MNDTYKLGNLCVKLGLGISVLFTAFWVLLEWGTWEVSETTFILAGFILALAGIIAKIIAILGENGITINYTEKR